MIKCVTDVPKQLIETETEAISESFSQNVMDTYSRYAIAMSHGIGSHLYDINGKKYIDCVAGIATCALGHAHPSIIKAVTQQISRTAHVSNLYYIPEQLNLAKWLVNNSVCDKVFFCNSGAEANEASIKLARKYWYLNHPDGGSKIPIIITAEGSFHGRTIATLTATGQPKYHKYWGPLLEGFKYVTYNNSKELKELCNELGDSLAGILMEPIQGEGGVKPSTKDFLKTARDCCDSVNALLIYDEVQVGMGRTGSIWAHEQYGVYPDVITSAKGLGGGLPIGAMLSKKHCDVFTPGDHASTFGGNPLATAAGSAVANELLQGGVLDNVNKRGLQLEQGLSQVSNNIGDGIIKEVRGKGLIIGVELKDGIKAGDVVAECSERGLLLVPAGVSVVRFVPPLIITKDEVDEVLDIFEDALKVVVSH